VSAAAFSRACSQSQVIDGGASVPVSSRVAHEHDGARSQELGKRGGDKNGDG
jgi:hypothetical protein